MKTLCGWGGLAPTSRDPPQKPHYRDAVEGPIPRTRPYGVTGCCSDSGHSFSAQDESERSPSAYAPRRSWHCIRHWCVASTADCFRRASARRSPDRRGRARHSSRPSSSSRRGILGSAVHGLRALSRERLGPTSIRTSYAACCRNTIAPSRAAPGPRGCRSSATRQIACGAWTSFDASPSCSGATRCSWSWTNARVASSESACTAVRSMAPTVDYVARRSADGRTKREIIRCLKRFLARERYQRVMTDFRMRQRGTEAA